MKNIALQLYSINKLTQNDFFGTLKKVAQIGYTGVEFAGYFNTPAIQLKSVMDKLGLKSAGSHIGFSELIDNIDKVIEYSLIIESSNIICPGLPSDFTDSPEGYKRAAEIFNEIGEKCKQNNIQFAYHNHDIEFKKFNNEYGIDILLQNTQKDLVHFEIDTYWVEYGGNSAVDFINKYKDRCSLLHIKDLKSRQDKRDTEIGKGIIDFNEVITLGEKYNTKWYIVEQEDFEIPLLESVSQSYSYLSSIL